MKNIILLFLVLISFEGFSQDSPGVYTIKNAKINTTFSDFGTAFLGDNKVVFASPKEGFTLNREENSSQPFLDLYMGEVTDDGQLIRKQKLPGDINTKFHEGMVSFSKDMKTVYFSANGKIKKAKRKAKKNIKTKNTITIQLFKATIDENGEWGNLEMLPFNSDDFSTGHPVLNRDDTKLYFVSDRPESYGKTDIFVVDIYGDGTYSEPVNLGPKINTAEREMFPFIGKDNVLYFSSDGIPGYGELDVFASKVFDNTVSDPINLEAPVNSEMDDFAYIINDTKHKGYFSSNREGGKGDDDIYAFTASPPIYIECEQEISGVVKNIDTQELIPNVQIMLFDENGTKLKSFFSSENDASFSFMQSCNTTYTLKGYLEGYLIGEMDIKTVNDLNADPIEIVMNMSVDPTTVVNPIAEASEASGADEAAVVAVVAEEADKAIETTNEVIETQEEAIAQSEFSEQAIEDMDEHQEAMAQSKATEDKDEHQEAMAQSEAKETAGAVAAEVLQESDPEEETKVQSEVAEEANEAVEAQQDAMVQSELTEQSIEDIDEQQEAIAQSEAKETAGAVSAEDLEESDPKEETTAQSEVAEGVYDEEDAAEELNSGEGQNTRAKTEVLAGNSKTQNSDLALNHKQDPAELNNIHINTIYFDFDKHDIRYDAQLEMDKLVKILKAYPQMKIKVSAHTDIRGTRKYNAGLSDRRADKTVEYLVKKGIESDRITGMGFGETQLAEKCTKQNPCTGFQHQLNRRSEFLIMKDGAEDFIVRSRNRQNSMDANANAYVSNSGLFTNYNFYEDNEVYTVQIGAFQGEVQTAKYSKLTNLFHHKYEDGFSRYFAGIFETSSEARNYMRLMRKEGFNDAFVVGLRGENRF